MSRDVVIVVKSRHNVWGATGDKDRDNQRNNESYESAHRALPSDAPVVRYGPLHTLILDCRVVKRQMSLRRSALYPSQDRMGIRLTRCVDCVTLGVSSASRAAVGTQAAAAGSISESCCSVIRVASVAPTSR
jgi:hypothetical protein